MEDDKRAKRGLAVFQPRWIQQHFPAWAYGSTFHERLARGIAEPCEGSRTCRRIRLFGFSPPISHSSVTSSARGCTSKVVQGQPSPPTLHLEILSATQSRAFQGGDQHPRTKRTTLCLLAIATPPHSLAHMLSPAPTPPLNMAHVQTHLDLRCFAWGPLRIGSRGPAGCEPL